MGLLGKLFGARTAESQSSSSRTASGVDPANDPNMIRLFDQYGRELFITRQEWRDKVLLPNLEAAGDNPDDLYSVIIGGLQEGFAADVVGYAERLREIDPIAERSATIVGVIYMELNRLDDAQRVFDEYIAEHGEDGVVLVNLAKVYQRRGDSDRAEKTLWHALELDPNQDNGLEWYAAIYYERGGQAAQDDAYRRVAAMPRSWRARLWLARNALQQKLFQFAEVLYTEAIAAAGRPVPSDLLMQMSGDLGNGGYLAEAIRLTEPHFDPAVHGLAVGNNLIKAHLDLGQIPEAKRVLEQLHAQKRPDWREALEFWDGELAKCKIAAKSMPSTERLDCSLITIEGPLWTRDGSPFAKLLPEKLVNARRIAVFGSTALLARPPRQPTAQLADPPGRLSRAVPLVLAEHIHLATDGVGIAVIPWIEGQGFALFGKPYDDRELCEMTGRSVAPPDFLLACTLDATRPTWTIRVRLLRCSDGRRINEASVEIPSDNPATAMEPIVGTALEMLVAGAGIHVTPLPEWYERPGGPDVLDYLLRLEQQLAVGCMNLERVDGGGLWGEREILDGTLQLCLRQPANPTVRMVLAQTLHEMRKARPEIVPEYRAKLDCFCQQHAMEGDVGALVESAIADSMT
jgi:tetratricopeptide (TPR) repeat protein